MPDYRRRAAREAMSVRLDVNGAMAETIGPAGAAREDIEALEPRLAGLAAELKARRAAGELPFYELPYQKDALTTVKALAAEVRGESDTLAVLGIGGSAAGTESLIAALAGPSPRVVVAD